MSPGTPLPSSHTINRAIPPLARIIWSLVQTAQSKNIPNETTISRIETKRCNGRPPFIEDSPIPKMTSWPIHTFKPSNEHNLHCKRSFPRSITTKNTPAWLQSAPLLVSPKTAQLRPPCRSHRALCFLAAKAEPCPRNESAINVLMILMILMIHEPVSGQCSIYQPIRAHNRPSPSLRPSYPLLPKFFRSSVGT